MASEDPIIPLWPSTDDELETDVGQDALLHLDHKGQFTVPDGISSTDSISLLLDLDMDAWFHVVPLRSET